MGTYDEVDLKRKGIENCKESLNSWTLQENPPTQEDRNKLDSDHCEQGLSRTSECSKRLPELCRKSIVEESDAPQNRLQRSQQGSQGTQVTCGDNFNELSQESSNCIGNNVSVSKFSWFKSMSQIVGLTKLQNFSYRGRKLYKNKCSIVAFNFH